MTLKELLKVVPSGQTIQILDAYDMEVVYYEDDKQFFKRESIENKKVLMVSVCSDDKLRIVIEV